MCLLLLVCLFFIFSFHRRIQCRTQRYQGLCQYHAARIPMLRQLIQFDCQQIVFWCPNGEVKNVRTYMTNLCAVVHSPYSDWINVSSDLEPRNSIAMTNGANEHSIHQKITCFRFLLVFLFSWKWILNGISEPWKSRLPPAIQISAAINNKYLELQQVKKIRTKMND